MKKIIGWLLILIISIVSCSILHFMDTYPMAFKYHVAQIIGAMIASNLLPLCIGGLCTRKGLKGMDRFFIGWLIAYSIGMYFQYLGITT